MIMMRRRSAVSANVPRMSLFEVPRLRPPVFLVPFRRATVEQLLATLTAGARRVASCMKTARYVLTCKTAADVYASSGVPANPHAPPLAELLGQKVTTQSALTTEYDMAVVACAPGTRDEWLNPPPLIYFWEK
jgi:hypothetical protein